MKKEFVQPDISVTAFSVEDIVTTSSGNTGAFDGEWVPISF